MVADVAHQLCPQTTFLSSGQKSGGYILWLHKNSPLAFEQAICSTPGRCGTLLQNNGQNSLSHSASAQGSAPAEWPEIRDLILGCEDLPLIVREMIVKIGDDQYETFPGLIQG